MRWGTNRIHEEPRSASGGRCRQEVSGRTHRAQRITLGADKGYDAAAFVADLRTLNVTPHIAQNISKRRSAIDARTTHHPGYAVSQRKRKRIEEPFGGAIGGFAGPNAARCEKAKLQIHLDDGQLQSHQIAKTHRGDSVMRAVQQSKAPAKQFVERPRTIRAAHATEFQQPASLTESVGRIVCR
jgi:hypothetical protein